MFSFPALQVFLHRSYPSTQPQGLWLCAVLFKSFYVSLQPGWPSWYCKLQVAAHKLFVQLRKCILSLYKKALVIWVKIAPALLEASMHWAEGLRFEEILTPISRSTVATSRGVPFIVYIWFRLLRPTWSTLHLEILKLMFQVLAQFISLFKHSWVITQSSILLALCPNLVSSANFNKISMFSVQSSISLTNGSGLDPRRLGADPGAN